MIDKLESKSLLRLIHPSKSSEADVDTCSAAESVEVSLIMQSLVPSLNVSTIKLHGLVRLDSFSSNPQLLNIVLNDVNECICIYH